MYGFWTTDPQPLPFHCTKNGAFHEGGLQWMWLNPQETADLVTFTEEILYGKLHFLCNVPKSLIKSKLFETNS